MTFAIDYWFPSTHMHTPLHTHAHTPMSMCTPKEWGLYTGLWTLKLCLFHYDPMLWSFQRCSVGGFGALDCTQAVETDFLIHINIFNLVWHRLFICSLKLHWLEDAHGSSGSSPVSALYCPSRALETSQSCLSCFSTLLWSLWFSLPLPPNGQEEVNNFY